MDVKVDNVLGKIERLHEEIHLAIIPRSIAEFLRDLIVKNKVKNILEIGSSAGYSTIWMADAVKDLGGHVYTTELSTPRSELARTHFKESGLEDYITLFKGDAKEVLVNWSYGEMDLIFIDALKSDYLKYYRLAFQLVKKGGIIVADDVGKFKDKVKDFLDFVKKDDRVDFEYIDLDDGLLIVYKK